MLQTGPQGQLQLNLQPMDALTDNDQRPGLLFAMVRVHEVDLDTFNCDIVGDKKITSTIESDVQFKAQLPTLDEDFRHFLASVVNREKAQRQATRLQEMTETLRDLRLSGVQIGLT